jgi:hypothetical protein
VTDPVAAPPAYAAYGLRLLGLAASSGDGRAEAPEGWETWTVSQEVGPADDAPGMTADSAGARIGLPGAGEIRLDRAARTIVFATRQTLRPEAVLHPGLVPAAAVTAWWAGRISVHASAVLVGDRVWGLLAEREGGKSTTAALLAERGCGLFSDDMVVVAGDRCFAGPGSVDLRADPAEALGGLSLGVVGQRARWRKPYANSLLEAPLAGWVRLSWSDDESVALGELPVGDRIREIDHHASLPITPDQLLDMALAPMLDLSRPRSLAKAAEAADRLLEALRDRD